MRACSLVALSLLHAAACREESEAQVKAIVAAPGVARNLAVLVLDGVRIEESFGDEGTAGAGYSDAYDGATEDLLPLMRSELLPIGALVKPGYAVGETFTQPGHADFLTGVRQSFSLPLDGSVGAFRLDLPTLFELARHSWGADEDQVVLTGNTVQMVPLGYSAHPGYGESLRPTNLFFDEENQILEAETAADGGLYPAAGQDDALLVGDMRQRLAQGARLVMSNLHQIDRSGHQHPNIHTNFVSDVDLPISQMWGWVRSEESGQRDETLLVAFTDHGRHRVQGDTPWRHHGDACGGCREVFMLLAGPGIPLGAEASELHILEDLGQTAAWLTGIENPYSMGMVMTDILHGAPDPEQPGGPRRLVSSRGGLAWQQATGDFRSRSELAIDESVWRDEEALLLEAPSLLREGWGDVLCFRRLAQPPDQDYWHWTAQCLLHQEGEWSDLGLPELKVSPNFQASLTTDHNGAVVMAFVDELRNQEDASKIHTAHARLRLFRWSEKLGWETSDRDSDVSWPNHLSLIWNRGRAQVAMISSENKNDMRHSRRLRICPVLWAQGGDAQYKRCAWFELTDDQKRSYERHAKPALTVFEYSLYVGFLAWRDGGAHLLVSDNRNAEMSWSEPTAADESGLVLPHVAPRWSRDGWLYWARLGEGEQVDICRVGAGMRRAHCQSTGQAHADSLAPDSGGVWASLSEGDGQWALQWFDWEDDRDDTAAQLSQPLGAYFGL